MSRLNLPPTSVGLRERAADLLGRVINDPDDHDADGVLDEIFDDIQGDEDFRFGSTSKLERQDAHLKTWIDMLRLYNRKTPGYADLTDQQIIDRSIKNATQEEALRNLQVFLRGVVGLSSAHKEEDEQPRYTTLVDYRNSAVFWMQREMKKRAPPKDEILNVANKTLQRMAHKWGVNKKRNVKTYFGRFELSQLIDWDTARSPYMPVTETHHLAWCLALICGVRPGSIGRAPSRDNQYLCFREIQITRGSAKGMFNSKIQFLYLKGNRDSLMPEEGLTFSINGSIHSGTLPMSVPHRLLVMLLRRGGLEDHDTLDSLLEGDEHSIAIKEEFLDQPVCRTAGPRELSITENAISAQSLSNYISEHAMHAGYPRGITMYCWRRKAATTWMRDVGPDRARQMMGHANDSRTLEEYYDQGFYDIPVFEMAMRQDTNVPQATLDFESSEVLKRMVDYKRLHGAFLNRQVNQILEDNKEYRDATEKNDTRAMINLENRARKLAIRAFHDERKKVHDKNLTQTEFERRKAALKKPGELVQRIRNAVRNKLRAQSTARSALQSATPQRGSSTRQETVPQSEHQERHSQDRQSAQDRELQELAENGDLDADDLIDAEDDYVAGQNQNHVNVNVDRPLSWDEGREETQDEFALAVEVFMTELGKERFHIPAELICVLCRSSPYRSEEDRNRIWASPAKLRNHQMGKPHSKQGEIYLKLQYFKEATRAEKFECPYGNCKGKYTTLEKLVRHIRKSQAPAPEDDWEEDERAALQLHDDEKRADGWYDEDFDWVAEQKKPDVLNANRRRNLGLQYTNERELPQPTEVEMRPTYKTVVGSGGDGAMMTEIPAQYQDILAFGDDEDEPYEHVAPASGSVVATGDTEDVTEYSHPLHEVPAHLQSTVALGDEGRAFEHPGLWREFAERN